MFKFHRGKYVLIVKKVLNLLQTTKLCMAIDGDVCHLNLLWGKVKKEEWEGETNTTYISEKTTPNIIKLPEFPPTISNSVP